MAELAAGGDAAEIDHEAGIIRTTTTCPVCDGHAPAPGALACWRCRGRFEIEREATIEQVFSPPMRAFLDTIVFFREAGVMPEPGGLMDQPALWVEATLILLKRLREVENAKADKAASKQPGSRDRKQPGPAAAAPRPKD